MLTGEKLGQAIAEAIKRKGVSQRSVAAHFGVKPPSVQDWIKRGTIDKAKLPELWSFFADVVGPDHWGISQKDMANMGGVHENVSEGPNQNGPYPLISDVIAGNWAELCDNFHTGDAEDWIASTKNLGRCGYMLRVYGKSMENPGGRYSFPDGMILHVNPDLEPMPGQFVIVRRESTKEATFKRYVLIEGKPFLEAINPDWPRELKYLALQPGDVWCGVVVDASIGSLP
ncbi:LexA family protein [Hydrogenophaga pseudoflava]|uniref:LexA family protein n=1 Tax=Hydrogenophaga pseudoflava TaxID=47421 RepID=UPI0027E56723|nr:S24 family peptidase [Hydrogenophaga pseudoflava]MDQ7745420.1 S24 family peptidase [Hydrogenophaga pseudoflava]